MGILQPAMDHLEAQWSPDLTVLQQHGLFAKAMTSGSKLDVATWLDAIDPEIIAEACARDVVAPSSDVPVSFEEMIGSSPAADT